MENSLETVLEEKEETHQDSQIPSAPPALDSINPLDPDGQSSAMMDTGDQGASNFCFDDQIQGPVEDKGAEDSSAVEVPSESENPRSLESENKVLSSSLLSRRNKTVCFLHIPVGGRIEGASFDADVEAEPQKEDTNWGRGEEEEEETFGSAKENFTPNISVVLNKQVELSHSDKENWTPEVPRDLKLGTFILDPLNIDGRDEEESIDSDEENLTPEISYGVKLEESQMELQTSSSNGIKAFILQEDMFHSERENETPEVAGGMKSDIPISENCVKNSREEDAFISVKDNFTPNISIVMDEGEEVFQSDKENLTPEISYGMNLPTSPSISFTTFVLEGDMLHSEGEVSRSLKSEMPISENCMNNSREEDASISVSTPEASCDQGVLEPISVGREEEKFDSNSENSALEITSSRKSEKSYIDLLRSPSNTITIDFEKDEIFSDKETRTPDLPSDLKLNKPAFDNSVKNERKEDIFPSDKENLTPDVSGVLSLKKLFCESQAIIEREIRRKRVERIPFQPLLYSNSMGCSPRMVDKSRTTSVESIAANSNSVNNAPRLVDETKCISHQPSDHCKEGLVKKKWNIVVDTDCFLDEESRRALQLLEGLRGTYLIIPGIVIRELDYLKRHESWLRKTTTKASSALQWIEECMVKASWWIHVQSSSETMPAVAPTPPASPRSLMEIVTPTAQDHVLDTALLFKRIKTDGQLVLLSNNITLKIKAMAEGLLCETPIEFRESLVDPCSKRFLWVESSPRGSTWSCSEETAGLTESYYHRHYLNARKTTRVAEVGKGLKVILLPMTQ